jgi:predicted amidohydrolase
LEKTDHLDNTSSTNSCRGCSGFANNISTEIGDFAAGNRVVVSPVGLHKIGTFVCYESVFPGFVRKFAAGGAEVLFNISDDGWFGKSAARAQHLSMVRMRAAENRRWILRSRCSARWRRCWGWWRRWWALRLRGKVGSWQAG